MIIFDKMSKQNILDAFIKLDFKETYKAAYYNNSICKNIANYGANTNDIIYVARHGEYFNISIQIFQDIPSLLNDLHVHEIYLNILSDYSNSINLISKYKLEILYQTYSNSIFRFIVDKYLELSNIKPFYSDYPNLIGQINKDPNLINLLKRIQSDPHDILQVKFKVINCGTLLPADWIDKEFDSGDHFHKEIDLLDCRINKPPVTYLCNYHMVKLCKKVIPNITQIPENISANLIYVQNKQTGKFVNLTNSFDKNTYQTYSFETISYLNENIYVIFNPAITFNPNPNLKNISIGYSSSLLQKALRRGKICQTNLLNAINMLGEAKPNLKLKKKN